MGIARLLRCNFSKLGISLQQCVLSTVWQFCGVTSIVNFLHVAIHAFTARFITETINVSR